MMLTGLPGPVLRVVRGTQHRSGEGVSDKLADDFGWFGGWGLREGGGSFVMYGESEEETFVRGRVADAEAEG